MRRAEICGGMCDVLSSLQEAGIAIQEQGSRHRLLTISLNDTATLWVTEPQPSIFQLEVNVIVGSSLIVCDEPVQGINASVPMVHRLRATGFQQKESDRHPWRERNSRGCVFSVVFEKVVGGSNAVKKVVQVIEQLLAGESEV